MRTYLSGRLLVQWASMAVGEALVRELVHAMTGRDPGPLHHRCSFCGSIEHGQPYVEAPLHVSVAHAPGLTVVAVTDVGPVGVDVEPFGVDEAWVRREAVGKALGVGLVGADDIDPVSTVLEERLDIPGHVAAVVVISEPEAPAGRARTASP